MDAEEIRTQIGSRLAWCRTQAKLEQAEVATRIGVSEGTVSKWERGITTPPADDLRAFLLAVKGSAQFVLGLTDHPTGLPVGEYILNGPGLRRAEAAESLDEIRDLYRKEGFVLSFRVPPQPELVAAEEAIEDIRRRVKTIEARLFGQQVPPDGPHPNRDSED